MANDKRRDDLTVFGKETDNDRTPQSLETGADSGEETGDREEHAAVQNEEIKDEQRKAAGDD